jgi:hypothetical protein
MPGEAVDQLGDGFSGGLLISGGSIREVAQVEVTDESPLSGRHSLEIGSHQAQSIYFGEPSGMGFPADRGAGLNPLLQGKSISIGKRLAFTWGRHLPVEDALEERRIIWFAGKDLSALDELLEVGDVTESSLGFAGAAVAGGAAALEDEASLRGEIGRGCNSESFRREQEQRHDEQGATDRCRNVHERLRGMGIGKGCIISGNAVWGK